MSANGSNNVNAVGGTGSSATDSNGSAINYASAASSGSYAGLANNVNVTRYDGQPVIFYRFKYPASGDMLVQRLWVGFSSAPGTTGTVDNPSGQHVAAIRYSTNTSDTVFQTVTANGTSSTITSTSVTPAAGTVYTVCIDMRDPASVKFYINGALTNTHTTNLPSSSSTLASMCRVVTLENVAKNFVIYSSKIFQK